MRKKIGWALLALVLVVPAVLLAVKHAELNRWAKTGLIHTRVYIYDLAVGGMTQAEAQAALTAKYQPLLDERAVRFLDEGQEAATLAFTEAQARYDFAGVTETAWQYGRRQGTRLRARVSVKPYVVAQPPAYSFNEQALQDFVTRLCESTAKKPVNASLDWRDGQVAVVPGRYGRAVHVSDATAQAGRLLAAQASGDVTLRAEPLKPAYTSDDLQYRVTRLGGFTTYYKNPEGDPRLANIRTAARRIHNRTVYPGEVFSAAAHIASGAPGSGYAKAVVLVGGQPVEDEGGGVCQVVTTLYNAVLRAELAVTERHNHSAKVGYAEYGFDATVAGDYYDLKFKNDTAHPLLVVSSVQNGQLTVGLYGYDKRPPGRSLTFAAELKEVTPPAPPETKKDPAIPAGEIWVYTQAQDGYKYDLYKYIYENGKLTGKEKVNSSAYKAVRGVTAIGA